MKKVLCILICALFLLSACGSQDSTETSGNTDNSSQPQAPASPTEAPQPENSLLPEDYNANFYGGRSMVATDGKYTFFIDSLLGYISELYRIESGNDSVPVLIASIERPSYDDLSDTSSIMLSIESVFATPDKLFIEAHIKEDQQEGSSSSRNPKLYQMNKDGTDVRPVNLSLPYYSIAAVDGFKILCEGQINDDIRYILFDLLTMEETDVTAFIPSNDSDEYIRIIGFYHDELFCMKEVMNGNITVSQIYAVSINTGEKREICNVESHFGAYADRFYDGYLFVQASEEGSNDTIFKSIDLATGKQYLIGRGKANYGNQILAFSQGTVYYLEDTNAICAVSKTGENNRYVIRDIFSGDEVGFCGIQAAGDWIYYERWMRDTSPDGSPGSQYTESTRPCRIRKDGSSGPEAPLIRRP